MNPKYFDELFYFINLHERLHSAYNNRLGNWVAYVQLVYHFIGNSFYREIGEG